MPIGALAHGTDWIGWRRATRAFILANVEPSDLNWTVGCSEASLPDAAGSFTVSRALLALAVQAFQAREAERFGLLYTLVWRAHHGELALDDPDDPDLRIARRWIVPRGVV